MSKWDNDYNQQPGPWGIRGGTPGLEQEIEEHADHYAELHPDAPDRTGLTGIARRLAARLRGTRGPRGGGRRGRNRKEAGTSSEDVWAREEARYRAKNDGDASG